MKKERVIEQLNESRNYLFTTLIFPCRLSYRTGQDTANCDTCRNSACIIYRLVAISLQRHEVPNMPCPFSLKEGAQVEKGQLGGNERTVGFKTNVDSVNVRHVHTTHSL